MVNSTPQVTEKTMQNLIATRREQEALIQALDAALLATGMTTRPAPASWLLMLTPQQRALVGSLYGAYPNYLTRHQLAELLPSPNRSDWEDRCEGIVRVIVSKTRAELGKGTIISTYGLGYRMSDEFYNSIPKKDLDLAA